MPVWGRVPHCHRHAICAPSLPAAELPGFSPAYLVPAAVPVPRSTTASAATLSPPEAVPPTVRSSSSSVIRPPLVAVLQIRSRIPSTGQVGSGQIYDIKVGHVKTVRLFWSGTTRGELHRLPPAPHLAVVGAIPRVADAASSTVDAAITGFSSPTWQVSHPPPPPPRSICLMIICPNKSIRNQPRQICVTSPNGRCPNGCEKKKGKLLKYSEDLWVNERAPVNEM